MQRDGMSLLSQFARQAPYGRARSIVVGPSVAVLPPLGPVLRSTLGGSDDSIPNRMESACRITRTLLATRVSDHNLAVLRSDLDDRVEVWTPALHLRSRDELLSVLDDPDDAFSEINVVVSHAVATQSTVLVEWRATGRFAGPLFLEGDELIEPTGAVIGLGGVLSLSSAHGSAITRVCCYHDRLALLEQMLNPPTAGDVTG